MVPFQVGSTDLLTPRHRLFRPEDLPRRPSLLLLSNLVMVASFPQTEMPSINSHPKTRLAVPESSPSHDAHHDEHAHHLGSGYSFKHPLPHAACRLLQHDTTRGHIRGFRSSRPRRGQRSEDPKIFARRMPPSREPPEQRYPEPTTPSTLCRPTVHREAGKPHEAPTEPRPRFHRPPRRRSPSDRTRCFPPPTTLRDVIIAQGRPTLELSPTPASTGPPLRLLPALTSATPLVP